MGFLSAGNTFGFKESEAHLEHVKSHGVQQFINFYRAAVNKEGYPLLWGDEIEYIVLRLDEQQQKALLSLRGQELLDKLTKEEEEMLQYKQEKKEGKSAKKVVAKTLWRPEYGRHMVEGTPGKPYGKKGMADLLNIQTSMAERRATVEKLLKDDEIIITMTNFPLFGARQLGQFTDRDTVAGGPIAHSLFTSDEIINPHHRFPTLTKNIQVRSGRRTEIYVPLFKDKNTSAEPLPLPKDIDETISPIPDGAKNSHVIYMDSMAFGMGCCCLQTTFQCENIDEARNMYDQFGVLSPILLALTAATPILRGYLSDNDVRWSVIAQGIDDRTREERGLEPLKKDKYLLTKSRYESISLFIGNSPNFRSDYNDLDAVYNEQVFERLQKNEIDDVLAKHVAHLFTRDPLVIYKDRLDLDDNVEGDHFENINSTNWQTVRFKIPPPNTSFGWRVEFRPMEVQMTDFENAAFVIWTILTYKAIKLFGLIFYIPMSKVDENMDIAHKRGASRNSKFLFRKNIEKESHSNDGNVAEEYEFMTMNEIFHGKGKFPGTQSYLYKVIEKLDVTEEVRAQIKTYIDFVGDRASGKLLNSAEYIRNFVQEHPDYKHDSAISHKLNYDIIKRVHQIEKGQLAPKELLGDYVQVSEKNGH